MKELTIEEKANRYDEAIERAKKWYDANTNEGYRGIFEDIFPELRESEDEKIRREMIKGISKTRPNTPFLDTNITREEALAWLEKQKELTSDEEKQGKEDVLWCINQAKKHAKDENEMGTCWFAEKWLEKQGEQKVSVVDFKAKDWYVSKVDGKIYNAKFMEKTPTNQARKLEIEKAAMSATGIIEQEEWFIKGAEWSDKNPSYISSEKQGEQKPAEWSEEMGKLCLDAIELLRDYASGVDKNSQLGMKICRADAFLSDLYHDAFYPSTYNMREDLRKTEWSEEDESILQGIWDEILANKHNSKEYEWKAYDKFLDWLKSLKDRVQPKQEWSEDDKERIKNIISVLDVQVCWDGATGKKGNPYQKEIDWLKSLKPQQQWKPTEAQLASLRIACDRNDRVGFDLTQLLKELKEL